MSITLYSAIVPTFCQVLGSVGGLIDKAEDPELVLQQVIREQFPGKERLIAPNVTALKLGMDWTRDNVPPIGLKVKLNVTDWPTVNAARYRSFVASAHHFISCV